MIKAMTNNHSIIIPLMWTELHNLNSNDYPVVFPPLKRGLKCAYYPAVHYHRGFRCLEVWRGVSEVLIGESGITGIGFALPLLYCLVEQWGGRA